MRRPFGFPVIAGLLLCLIGGLSRPAAADRFEFTGCGNMPGQWLAKRKNNGWMVQEKDQGGEKPAQYIRYRTVQDRCQVAAPMTANRSGFMIFEDTGEDPPTLLIGQVGQLTVVDWTGSPRTVRYDPVLGRVVSKLVQGIQMNFGH